MSTLNPAGWVASAQATNATATATAPSPPSGKRTVIFGIDASFSATPAAPVLVEIKDGTTVIWQFYMTASMIRGFERGLAVSGVATAVLAGGGSGVTGSINFDGVTI